MAGAITEVNEVESDMAGPDDGDSRPGSPRIGRGRPVGARMDVAELAAVWSCATSLSMCLARAARSASADGRTAQPAPGHQHVLRDVHAAQLLVLSGGDARWLAAVASAAGRQARISARPWGALALTRRRLGRRGNRRWRFALRALTRDSRAAVAAQWEAGAEIAEAASALLAAAGDDRQARARVLADAQRVLARVDWLDLAGGDPLVAAPSSPPSSIRAVPSIPSLLSPGDLAALRDDVVVLDASTHLSTTSDGVPYTVHPHRDEFLAEHVPHARFADLASGLSDPAGRFAFTLPTPDAFAAAASALGIADGSHVVVYSNTGLAWATRVWWLLRVFGHDRVSVLDGGLQAWRDAGLPVETGESAPPPAVTFTPRFRPELVARTDEVSALSTAGGTVVCALDPATFRGESTVNPYSRRGHIPGSGNLPASVLVDRTTGRLLDRDALAEKLRESGLGDAGRAVTYCGGGIAATLPAFAAYVVSGAEVAVYDGSLSEWTADPDLPVVVG